MVVHERTGIGARRIPLLMSSRTARRAEPVRHPGRPAGPSRYVIPDGPQGRAGIQTGVMQEPLDPRLRGDDSKKGCASLF